MAKKKTKKKSTRKKAVPARVEAELLPPSSEENRERIKELFQELGDRYYELGRRLWEVKNSHSYLDWSYGSFEEYLEVEVGKKIRAVQDYIRIWENLDQRLGIPWDRVRCIGWCLDERTKIPTSSGMVEIGDVQVGDEVLASDGRWDVVEERVSLPAHDLFEISGLYFPTLRVTGHHRFPVIQDGSRLKRIAYKRAWRKGSDQDSEFLKLISVSEVEVSDLSEGDMLLFPEIVPEFFDAGEFSGMTCGFFEFCGWYAAEGYYYNGQLRITLGIEAENTRDYLADLARSLFPECSVRTLDLKESFRLSVSGAGVPQKFRDWFGIGAQAKTFPDAFFGLSLGQVRGFLDGLWSGDGSMNHKGIHLVATISSDLALRTRLLATRFGVLAGLHESTPKNVDDTGGAIRTIRKTLWVVHCGAESAVKIFPDLAESWERKSISRCHTRTPYGFAVPIAKIERVPSVGQTVHLQTSRGTFCCPVKSFNSKLKTIVPVATNRTTAEKWLQKAEKKSRRELETLVRRELGKGGNGTGEGKKKKVTRIKHDTEQELEDAVQDNGTPFVDPSKITHQPVVPEETEDEEGEVALHEFKVYLLPHQYSDVMAAMERAKHLTNSQKDNFCLHMISTEFNNTFVETEDGGVVHRLQWYVKNLEEIFGVSIEVEVPRDSRLRQMCRLDDGDES